MLVMMKVRQILLRKKNFQRKIKMNCQEIYKNLMSKALLLITKRILKEICQLIKVTNSI